MISENDNLNVDNNRLINISVNQNVLNSCESIRARPDSGSRTDISELRDKISERSRGFNLEMSGSLRPNGQQNARLREWEENILLHLNNVNLVEKDDCKTRYVKFKLFKRDIYTG